jgi:hypothetical protein
MEPICGIVKLQILRDGSYLSTNARFMMIKCNNHLLYDICSYGDPGTNVIDSLGRAMFNLTDYVTAFRRFCFIYSSSSVSCGYFFPLIVFLSCSAQAVH